MTKKLQPPYAVGDKVTTDFHPHDRAIVRAVTKVKSCSRCESGWLVSVDTGTACSRCERAAGEWLTDLDAGWLEPHKKRPE